MTAAAWSASVLAAVAVMVAGGPRARAERRVRSVLGRRRPAAQPGPAAANTREHGPTVLVERLAGAVGRRLRCLGGRPDDPGLDRRLGRAVLVAAAVVVPLPLVALPVAVAVWAFPAWPARSRRRREHDALAAELPDLVELFRLATRAGLTIHQSVEAVADRALGIGGAAVATVPPRVAVGERLADALEDLAGRDELLRPLVAALVSAERYGVALGPTLDRLADDARVTHRRRAEERARRLPIHMLFPLVLCILPGFLLLTVVPLAITAATGLAG